MCKEVKDNVSFIEFIGFERGKKEDGRFCLELRLKPYLLQDEGIIHPGVYSTMLDIVMGATLNRAFHCFATTINLNVSFFNFSPQQLYKAETLILHRDGNYVTAEGIIKAANNMIMAKGNGTFKISSKEGKNEECSKVRTGNVL